MPKSPIGRNPLTKHQAAVDAVLEPKKATRRAAPGRKLGRPPAGLDGERVSDYKRTTLYVPPASKQKLDTLSRYLDVAQWRVFVSALDAYEAALDPADRAAIRQMLKKKHR